MKKKLLILTLIATFGLTFVVTTYAHKHYNKEDIKVETKKVDKGIQIIITSDDPEVVKDIQKNSGYYENILAYSDCCPNMKNKDCMWQ